MRCAPLVEIERQDVNALAERASNCGIWSGARVFGAGARNNENRARRPVSTSDMAEWTSPISAIWGMGVRWGPSSQKCQGIAGYLSGSAFT